MDEKYYKIQSVADKTGVNVVTLRAWERRYALLSPMRTEKGHRLYTFADIERILQILELTAQGIPISQVKNLLHANVKTSKQIQPKNIWQETIDKMLHAIYEFNTHELDKYYSDIMSIHSVDIVVNNVILPILKNLGDNWSKRAAGIAEEHFFTIFLRNKIGARLNLLMASATGPKIILSGLPNEQHELGMLLFALYIIPKGLQPILIGASTPLEQMPPLIEQTRAELLVLYGKLDPNLMTPYKIMISKFAIPTILVKRDKHSRQDGNDELPTVPANDFPSVYKRIKAAL